MSGDRPALSGADGAGWFIGSLDRDVVSGAAFYTFPGSARIRGRPVNGSLQQTPHMWMTDGRYYQYNTEPAGSGNLGTFVIGKAVHQYRREGYSYMHSANEPEGTSQQSWILQNIYGPRTNADPTIGGGAYSGGSIYYNRVRILGKDIQRANNKGGFHLNNPVNDAEFRINLSNVRSGSAGQAEIAIGMYQDDYYNGPGNDPGKWTFSVRGDGYVFAKGFHNNSDPTNKDFEAPVMANNEATTKLKDLTILPFRYKNDDGTPDPTGPIHYGFNADEFVDLDLDDFGIVSTSGVAAESDFTDPMEPVTDMAPIGEAGDPTSVANPATALAKEDPGTQLSLDPLAVTALTVQVVQQVEARVTTLEAAPPSSGGIDSDTTTGGNNTVAIANMVTIPTGANGYGAIGFTPNPTTVYFLT